MVRHWQSCSTCSMRALREDTDVSAAALTCKSTQSVLIKHLAWCDARPTKQNEGICSLDKTKT